MCECDLPMCGCARVCKGVYSVQNHGWVLDLITPLIRGRCVADKRAGVAAGGQTNWEVSTTVQ